MTDNTDTDPAARVARDVLEYLSPYSPLMHNHDVAVTRLIRTAIAERERAWTKLLERCGERIRLDCSCPLMFIEDCPHKELLADISTLMGDDYEQKHT